MKLGPSANQSAAPSFADRQAQYAAWKDRIMSREDDDVVVVDEAPSKWSLEGLFAGLPVD